MNVQTDYYAVLGVSSLAPEEAIVKAFRALAQKHHPDKAGGNLVKMKLLNEAKEVLTQRRALYDRERNAWLQRRTARTTGTGRTTANRAAAPPPRQPPPPPRQAAGRPPPRRPPPYPRSPHQPPTRGKIRMSFVILVPAIIAVFFLTNWFASWQDQGTPETTPTQPAAREPTVGSAHPTSQMETRCVPADQAPVACNPTNPHEAVSRHATWDCDHVAISRYPDGTYDLCQCRWCQQVRVP